MRRELDIAAYRLVVRFTLLASVGLVVFGLYRLLQSDWGLGLLGVGAGVLALVPSQYFRIRPDPAAARLLILLTRPNCSLCDEARAVMKPLAAEVEFTIQEINIDDDRQLRRRFKNLVPVVIWQGEEWAQLRVDVEDLRRRLQQAATAR